MTVIYFIFFEHICGSDNADIVWYWLINRFIYKEFIGGATWITMALKPLLGV